MKESMKTFSRHLLAFALATGSVVACAASSGPTESVGTTSSALAVTGLFPTGVDANGTPLARGAVDPHYTLTSTDPLFPGPNAVAVNAQASMAGAGAWTPNTATSNWISIQADAVSMLPLVYTYTTTFNLNGNDPTTATLAGMLACDDTCVLRLNGTMIKTFASPAWTAPAAFSIPAGSNFVAGSNRLSVSVTNSGGIVTGLQITNIAPGCSVDGECATTQFCDTATAACVPKIPDGSPVPTIGGHTPPLTGTCTAAAGTAVCVSGVCSATTNDCGTTAPPACTTDAECTTAQFCNTQSMTCTPKLPNGTPVPTVPNHTPPLVGTCSAAVGAAVCVSGACDMTSNDCAPAAPPTCTTDSQCPTGQFCNTQTMACTPKLPDGTPIPTVPGHTPALTGMCTTAVGAAVCISDACNMASNACGAGCAVDTDCASTQFCDTQTLTCAPKLPNGEIVPTITGHTPALTGVCSAPVGTAVCASAVCDMTNNECGYANGDGPCTAANGGTVCQSGMCAANGTCAPGTACMMDSDCTSAQFCNTQAGMCTAKLPNGTPIPNLTGHTPPLTAMCTPGAGTAVCVSTVCDMVNNECGYANGDGPCTTATALAVCQSGVCNAAGTCGPGVACTVDSDCTDPSRPVCDPTFHICVPADGGAGNGAGDAGNGNGSSGGGNGDAGNGNGGNGGHDADASGFVEGGGCSVTGPASSSTNGSAVLLVGAAIAFARGRRRRATRSAPTPNA